MVTRARVLLVSGSLRARSTNTAVLRTARALAPVGVEAVLYGGLDGLPPFNPDLDRHPLPGPVAELRTQIQGADAIMFSIPEYAGALPGALKNLLDWTIGDDQPRSIYQKPVAWINASPRGADHAHQQLRMVLDYAHATIVDCACAHIPITAELVGDDLHIAELRIRSVIEHTLTTLIEALPAGNDRET